MHGRRWLMYTLLEKKNREYFTLLDLQRLCVRQIGRVGIRSDLGGKSMEARAEGLAQTLSPGHAKPIPQLLVGGLIRVFDVVAIFTAGLIIYFLHVRSLWQPMSEAYFAALVAGALAGGGMLHWAGVYSPAVLFARRPAIGRLLSGWAVAFSVLLAIAFSLKVSDVFSRIWATTWFVSTLAVLALGHMLINAWIRDLAAQGRFAARTVIVGAGRHGRRLADHLTRFGDVNTRLIGMVDDRADRITRPNGLPLLGDTSYLLELVRRDLVDQVFIALPWNAENRVRDLVHKLATTPVRIRLTPDLVGFHFMDRSYEQVARLPMLNLYDRPISGGSFVLKSIEDRCLAVLALILLTPLMAAIALAIKLDSPGPVFFRQKRLGFNSNLIRVWKFRTMYTDLTDVDCEVQTKRDDPRVTRVGSFLRCSSLDELPQLFNVLFGDMSLVGPRPHALETKAAGRRFEEVVDRYAARHRVKPGITGWAQVNGWRGETDTVEKIQKRVEFDLYYIDNWSIWFDIEIIWRTLVTVFKDHRAF